MDILRVSKQYIGKSKLKFQYKGKYSKRPFPISKETLIGDLSRILFIPGGYQTLPDYYLSGTFSLDEQTFSVNYDHLKIGLPYQDILYITGVPKETLNLDIFRLENSKWSSYYEDAHGGYLFQILNYKQSLNTIQHGKYKC